DFHVTGVQTCALPISSSLAMVTTPGRAGRDGGRRAWTAAAAWPATPRPGPGRPTRPGSGTGSRCGYGAASGDTALKGLVVQTGRLGERLQPVGEEDQVVRERLGHLGRVVVRHAVGLDTDVRLPQPRVTRRRVGLQHRVH